MTKGWRSKRQPLNSLWWPVYVINSADSTKLLCCISVDHAEPDPCLMKKNDGNELAKSVSDRIRFSPCSPCHEARSHYLRMPEQDQIKVRSIHTKIPVACVESRGSEILAFEKTDDVTAN